MWGSTKIEHELWQLIVGCLAVGALMGIGAVAWLGWINPKPEQVGPCCEELREYIEGGTQ